MVDVEIEGNQIEDEDTDEEVVIVEDEDDYGSRRMKTGPLRKKSLMMKYRKGEVTNER